MKSQPPVPEWAKEKVLLVDPAIWERYRTAKCDLRPVYRDLQDALDLLGIEYHLLSRGDSPLDIWIRDWGFMGDCYCQYDPSYARNHYTQPAIKRARKRLDSVTGRSHRPLSIVLDGGNLVHDGRTAILTEKVFRDNPSSTRSEIERAIVSMGFDQVIFVPVEPADGVGHADGMVRFLRENLLLVNDYHGPFRAYGRDLLGHLKSARKSLQILLFPWDFTSEKRDGIWSAMGCYINFLQTSRGIVLPAFGARLDDRALAVLAELCPLPALPVSAEPVARLGGVLNCVALPF
jgi:agmatine deiminase